MTKFKVGDRVRAIYNSRPYFTKGAVYEVSRHTYDGWLVCEKTDTGGPNKGAAEHEFELVAPATDELATLRSFREQAIARYPDLAEPETDEEAAERIYNEWVCTSKNSIELVLSAIAWARANPR